MCIFPAFRDFYGLWLNMAYGKRTKAVSQHWPARVGPSKVGVENYHAWGGILAIFEVSRGYFLPSKPTQHPREAWGFRRFLLKSGTFYPKQHFFWISPVTLPTRIGLKSSQSSKQHSESNTTRFITLQV